VRLLCLAMQKSAELPPRRLVLVHSDRLASSIGDGCFHGKARVLPSAQAGLLPIGQGIDVGVNTRVGSVGHAGSTVT